jgi:TP901 family phage tail tape measure protein
MVADLYVRLAALTAPYTAALTEASEQGEAFTEAQKTQQESVKAANEESAKSFGLIGRAVAGSVVAMAAASAVSLKWATDFQTSVTKLYTQAGLSSQQLSAAGYSSQSFQDKLLSLGAMAGFTGTQVADALYHPISAGLDLNTALQVVSASEKEARISGADLTDTTYTLSTVMKAFNYPASQAAQTMATLNAIVGNGDTTFQDLNESVKTWAPTATAFGVSLTSVGSALDYLTDRGDSATTAGTHLAMMMAMMVGQTKQAAGYMTTLGLDSTQVTAANKAMAAAFEKSGITSTRLSGDLRKPDGIYVALQDLQGALRKSGLSANEANDLLVRAFGGGKQFKTLAELMTNLTGLKSKFDSLTQQGSVQAWQHDWTMASNTLKVQLDRIGASIENLGIKFGTWLIPYVQKFLGFLTSRVAPVVASFAKAVGGVFGQVGQGLTGSVPKQSAPVNPTHAPPGILNAVGGSNTLQTAPKLSGWQKFGEALRGIIGNLVTFGRDVAQAGVTVGRVLGPIIVSVGQKLLGAFEALGRVLAKVAGPAIKAFAGFIAGHQGAIKFFAEVIIGGMIAKFLILKGIAVATAVTNLATAVVAFPFAQMGQIGTAFGGLKTALAGLRLAAVTAFQFVAGGIATAASAVGSAAATMGTAIWGVVTAVWGWVSATAAAVGKALWQGMVWAALRIKTTALAVAEKTAAAGEWLLNLAMDANPIMLIIAAIALLVGAFVALWVKCKWFREFWIRVWNDMVGGIKTAFGFVDRIISDAVDWIKSHLGIILDFILGPMTFGIFILVQHWTQVWNGIQAVTSAVWSFIRDNVLQPIVSFFTGVFTGALNGFETLWNSVWGGLGQAVNAVYNNVIKPVFGTITTAIDNLASGFNESFSGIGSFIQGAFDTAVGFLKIGINKVIGAANWVINQLDKISFTLPSWIPGVGGETFGVNIPDIPTMDVGGWIPGRSGQPVPMIGHGGEYVLSQDMLRGHAPIAPGVIAGLLGGGAPTPHGGTVLSTAASSGGGTVVYQVTVNVAGNVTSEAALITAVQRGVLQVAARNSNNGLVFAR